MNLETEIIPMRHMIRNEDTDDLEFDILDIDEEEILSGMQIYEINEQEGINIQMDEASFEESEESSEDEHSAGEANTGRIKGVDRALRNLQTYFNPAPWSHSSDEDSLIISG
jgi:hypothetical protein